MSAGKEAPLDKITGQTLPVYFTADEIDLKGRNHHPNHPNKRDEFADPIGRALRHSRVHWTPDRLHMGNVDGAYHDVFWGPWIAQDISTAGHKHLLTVLNLAQVVPRHAIELDGQGGFQEKYLNDKEHSFLSMPQITHIEGNSERQKQFNRFKIGHGLIDYALNQDLSNFITRKTQEKFTKAKNEAVVRELGNLIIHRAVEESVKPIEPIYQSAHNSGMVHRSESLRRVVRRFLPEHEFGSYYRKIRDLILMDANTSAGELPLAA